MAEHAIESPQTLDEFLVSPLTREPGETFDEYPFISGEQQPGDVYVETPDKALFRISVGEEDVTVASGELTRHGFSPIQEPISIAHQGVVSVMGQPRSQRSKQHEVREFDVSANGDRLTVVSNEVPLRVIAPSGYFYRPNGKKS